MLVTDTEIIKFYRLGWNQEPMPNTDIPILKKAYEFGNIDFIVGDDIRSVDYQTEEQILESIKK
jgi:hypothetical protein